MRLLHADGLSEGVTAVRSTDAADIGLLDVVRSAFSTTRRIFTFFDHIDRCWTCVARALDEATLTLSDVR
jgi:hypothetical protein